MLKSDLIAKVMETMGGETSKNAATACVDTVLAEIVKGLQTDGEVRIAGFGTFKRKDRPARMGPKPGSPGVKIEIKASSTVTFKAGKELKTAMASR